MNVLTARWRYTPLKESCGDIDELLRHIANQPVVIQGRGGDQIEIGFNVGEETPGEDYTALPWLKQDSAGNWSWQVFENGQWEPVCCHDLGDIKTKIRVADTIAEDLPTGWIVLDSTAPAPFPNLSGDSNYFAGTAPNWDMYTVGYIGTGEF